MRTIKQIIRDENLNIDTNPLTLDGTKLYINMTMVEKENGNLDNIYNAYKEDDDNVFICEVFLKRITGLKLEERVDKSMFILLPIFEINNPGEAMLLLITLLDFHTEHDRKATMNDIGMELFPNGFYTRDTCMLLVDNYVKTGKAVNGFIY